MEKIFIFFSVIAGYFFIIYYLHPLSASVWGTPDPNTINSLDVTYDYGFVRCFFGFLFGMLLYELYRVGWGQRHLKRDTLWLLTLGAIIFVMSNPIPDLVPVLVFGALILVSVYTEGIGRKILSLKPFVYLGDISYSLYLMHLPLMSFILSYLRKYPGVKLNPDYYTAWIWALVFLAIVIAVSSLTYRFVEVPLRKKIGRK